MSLASGSKLWFVGDSKTKGDPTLSGTTYANCYRRRTVSRLTAQGVTGLVPVGTQTDTDGVAHDGINLTTLSQHLATIQANFAAKAPNLVILDGGTNDAGSGGPYLSGSTIVGRVEAIVDWVLAQNASVCILVSNQPWVYFNTGDPIPALQNANLKDFNQLLPAMIASKDPARCRWFDSSVLLKTDLNDNVHPNQVGSDKRAYMAVDQIQRWTTNGWLAPWPSTDFGGVMPSVTGAIPTGSTH